MLPRDSPTKGAPSVDLFANRVELEALLFDRVIIEAKPKKAGLHDSGYRFLRVVGIRDVKGVGSISHVLSEWSDVVHFRQEDGRFPQITGWNMDVDDKGNHRFFSFGCKIKVKDPGLSSCELVAVKA